MSPGSTRSGGVLEGLIVPVLRKNAYTFTTQTVIGLSVSGKKHRVDALVTVGEYHIPVSLKWQEVSGSAEEKVPYEVIKLIHAVKTSDGLYRYAYLVIGGEGWSKIKDFYMSGGLKDYILGYDRVRMISLEGFITRANRRTL